MFCYERKQPDLVTDFQKALTQVDLVGKFVAVSCHESHCTNARTRPIKTNLCSVLPWQSVDLAIYQVACHLVVVVMLCSLYPRYVHYYKIFEITGRRHHYFLKGWQSIAKGHVWLTQYGRIMVDRSQCLSPSGVDND